MSTGVDTRTFKHFDDCLMSGCPGHEMRAEHQTTSDYFSVYIDDELIYGGDDTVTRTMVSLLSEVDYQPSTLSNTHKTGDE